MTAIPSPRKPKGAGSKADVARHVLREHEKTIARRSETPEYVGSEQEATDKAWLAILQARVPQEQVKKNLNPIKNSKKGK